VALCELGVGEIIPCQGIPAVAAPDTRSGIRTSAGILQGDSSGAEKAPEQVLQTGLRVRRKKAAGKKRHQTDARKPGRPRKKVSL
jgi:hypothetical protein